MMNTRMINPNMAPAMNMGMINMSPQQMPQAPGIPPQQLASQAMQQQMTMAGMQQPQLQPQQYGMTQPAVQQYGMMQPGMQGQQNPTVQFM